MTSQLQRLWIDQPSTLQPLHHLHSTRVLGYCEYDDTWRIYFLDGNIVSMQVPTTTLSYGWHSNTPPSTLPAAKRLQKYVDLFPWDDRQAFADGVRTVLAALEAAQAGRPAPRAEPPATERMRTHWETCATDGGPRHYDCATALIERQAHEIAELRGLQERNEGRIKAIVDDALLQRAERAEAERDALRADAERYRWMRENNPQIAVNIACGELDAAIAREYAARAKVAK